MNLDELAEKYADWYQTERGSYVGANEYLCLAEHIGDCSGKKIIEVGSGTGFFLRKFALKAEEAVGFDLTPGMLEAGRKIAEAKGIEISFIQGNVLEGLPFADNYFDIVYSNSMIEFFKKGKEANTVLAEMWRLLKPGGKFVIGVLNKESTWAYKRTAETLEKDSIFSREIKMIKGGFDDEYEINVIVRWNTHETIGVRQIVIKEYIYNWATGF
jgi:ubiquinone/menaquinone biosynthesis C-methylase UbiE